MTTQPELDLPPLVPYPPVSIQTQLPPEEWQICLDSWIAGIELRLSVSEEQLSSTKFPDDVRFFLIPYLSQYQSSSRLARNSNLSKLDTLCYRLVSKLVLSKSLRIPPSTYFELLSSSSIAYATSTAWKKTLKQSWASNQIQIKKGIDSLKVSLLASSTSIGDSTRQIKRLSALTKALPDLATVAVAGADYLDTLTELFQRNDVDLKKAVTENVFYSFMALLENNHMTILTDNIYHMKSEADRLQKKTPDQPTILSSLLCTTTFLKHLSSNSEAAARKRALLDQLAAYRQTTLHLHPRPLVRRRKKGKEISRHDDNMHMHKAAQVSQVHELFPDLTTAYIMKALDYFQGNVESVIGGLLEPDNLPPALQDKNVDEPGLATHADAGGLAPRSTPDPSPARRPSIDNIGFEDLQIESERLRRGKKVISLAPATTDEQTKSKAAIMSALAAFDADDDERDDTYDVADVGGAVDNTVDTDERGQPESDAHEAMLFQSWKENPEVFSRDSKTRVSNIRQQLKRETGMSDEQIEGWAIILTKDKRQQARLEGKYTAVRAFGGQQRVLESTRWQAGASTENSENESGPDNSNDHKRMGQAAVRGHRGFGRVGGRGGGSTSGPPDDAATQAARRRKEQGRGRGGSNHRKASRAKKVGRGMGPVPQ